MLGIAIVGPEGTGKSLLFELLTGTAPQERTLSDTFTPPVGTVSLPDSRLESLQQILKRPKYVPLAVEVKDYPGFTSGTPSRLLNRILPEIKQADLLLMVVQGFSVAEAERVLKATRAFGDELLILDLAIAENALKKHQQRLRGTKKPEQDARYKLLSRVAELLEASKLLHNELTTDEKKQLRDLALLTLKNQLIVINVDEEVYAKEELREGISALISEEVGTSHIIPVKLAVEFAELGDEERDEFRQLYGINEPLVPPLKRSILKALDHIVFYTFNEKELRAWSIPAGATALDAAGAIHSDLAQGFIRADVIPAEEFISAGSEKVAREEKRWRTEGRDYTVQDGDIILVKFNR
ncbi:MAG: hypothetical protein B1H03_01575 [Planctomycetales bacterium 4484_113]|nr:MAG: hypothetical protein B1H03_01575 [Planctomycetales bacterium 4484_113]